MGPEIRRKVETARSMVPLSEEAVDEFLDLIEEIVDSGDPSVIGPILLLADEYSELAGVEVTFLSFLEDFDPRVYVAELLGVLEEFHLKSPGWCRSEIRKILASEEGETLITTVADQPDSTRKLLAAILARIQAQTPRLSDVCERLLEQMSFRPNTRSRGGNPSELG